MAGEDSASRYRAPLRVERVWNRRSFAKEVGRLHAKRLRKSSNYGNCWIPDSAFYATDVSSMKPGLVSELLLGPTLSPTMAANIRGEKLVDVHACKIGLAHTIGLQPRSHSLIGSGRCVVLARLLGVTHCES